jgi:molecular chaperone DnaK
MSNFVGIDLGTTFSAIARLNSIGKPEIVPNADGERITPSIVYFPSDDPGSIFVGLEAKQARALEDSRVVAEVKREMGESELAIELDGQSYSPEAIAAIILEKLRKDAVQQIGDIADAVITVPAYFEESHRKATMDAGEIAGLNVRAIVNEPTAAALFYATNHEVNGKVVVYDLGGGTFDVTVMDVNGKEIDIISSEGDRHLGGVDFDNFLLDLLNRKYNEQFGADLIQKEADRSKHLDGVETLKKTLSRREKGSISLAGEAGQQRFEVTRAEFEELISPIIAKSEMLVEMALDEANVAPTSVDKVLLVGGSCRIPFVQQRLKTIFGFEPSLEVNVDECVALGAAIHAGLKATEAGGVVVPAGIAAGLKDIQLTDVCNHSYGTIVVSIDEETNRECLKNEILLAKNTALPCSRTETYYTVADGQQSLNVRVTQCESDDPEYAKVLFDDDMPLPPNRPAGRPVEITYTYDTNQRMHCLFKDVESGRQAEVSLTDSGGRMTAEKKEDHRAALESFQIE